MTSTSALAFALLTLGAESSALHVVVPAGDPRVLVVGHVERKTPLVLTWSGSELRLRFTGTSIAVDAEARAHGSDDDWFVVVVDGKRTDVDLPHGRATTTLAKDLAPDVVHELSFMKRTEALVGDVAVLAFIVDPGADLADAPAPRATSIAFLGDSLTTGFGVLGKDARCRFSSDTEDLTKSFAGVVARRLDADLSVVAWSGRGVYRDYSSQTEPEVLTVPTLWRHAPHLSRAPDAVVVALGNNDFSDGVPDRGAFMKAMHALLDDVRRAYPNAHIVLTSPMPLTQKPDDPIAVVAPQWINAIFHQRGDGKLSWVKLPARDDSLGVGCLWHPGKKMHEKLADVVEAELRARLSPR